MKAFLSHSSADKPIANVIYKYLRDSSVDIWFDRLEMRPGDSLLKRIADGIESSDYLLFLISEKSKKSPWVIKELEIALSSEMNGNGMTVIPILLEDTELPTSVVNKLYLNVGSDGSGVEDIISAIYRDSFVLRIDISDMELDSKSSERREELYEFTRQNYSNIRVTIANGGFNSGILEIINKSNEEFSSNEQLLRQINRVSESFDIEMPIFWSNFSAMIGILLNEIFDKNGKNITTVKMAKIALDRSLKLVLVSLFKKIQGAVFEEVAESCGYYNIAKYLVHQAEYRDLREEDLIEKLFDLSEDAEMKLLELVPCERKRNIGSRFVYPVSQAAYVNFQMCNPVQVSIPEYDWFTVCLPQLLNRHLLWTAFREGKPISEIGYDVGFNMSEYKAVGFA